MTGTSLLDRLRSDPTAHVDVVDVVAPDADRVVAALGHALGDAGAEAAWCALDDVADLHDPETLDIVLSRVVPGGPLALLRGGRRRALRELARRALARSDRPGAVRLAAALLGAVGTNADVADLETLGAHPAFTLHAATALAARGSHAAIGALLRLLARTDGAARVLVIDRLLAFVRQPVVRLALVRDAFTGLEETLARDIAPAVRDAVDATGLATLADDHDAPDELRAGAARLLRLAGPPASPHDLGG